MARRAKDDNRDVAYTTTTAASRAGRIVGCCTVVFNAHLAVFKIFTPRTQAAESLGWLCNLLPVSALSRARSLECFQKSVRSTRRVVLGPLDPSRFLSPCGGSLQSMPHAKVAPPAEEAAAAAPAMEEPAAAPVGNGAAAAVTRPKQLKTQGSMGVAKVSITQFACDHCFL